jgi:hypothetical protein
MKPLDENFVAKFATMQLYVNLYAEVQRFGRSSHAAKCIFNQRISSHYPARGQEYLTTCLPTP